MGLRNGGVLSGSNDYRARSPKAAPRRPQQTESRLPKGFPGDSEDYSVFMARSGMSHEMHEDRQISESSTKSLKRVAKLQEGIEKAHRSGDYARAHELALAATEALSVYTTNLAHLARG